MRCEDLTEIKRRIKRYFLQALPFEIGDDEDIFHRAIVDSLFAIQLVAFVEEEFSISAEATDLDINNFCSVSALTRFVERKLVKEVSDERHSFRDG